MSAPQSVTDPPPVKVAVGPSTVAGYSVTAVGLVLAVLAFISGDRSEQTLGVIAAGAISGLAFLVTQVGRYAQARELAKKMPAPSAVNLASAEVATDAPIRQAARLAARDAVDQVVDRLPVAAPAIPADVDASGLALTDGDPDEVPGTDAEVAAL